MNNGHGLRVGTAPPAEFQQTVGASARWMEGLAGRSGNGSNGKAARPRLVGTDGRPLRSASSLGATSVWPGSTGGFKAGGHSRETALLPSICRPTNDELKYGALATMRARSRYVYNNHAHAHGLLDKIVRRVAGKGTKFQPWMRDATTGKRLREQNKELEYVLKAVGRVMTPGGDSFKGLRELGMLLRLVDGELLALKTVNPRKRLRLAGQSFRYSRDWQVLDSDQMAENVPVEQLPEVKPGNTVDLGVEREKSGCVAAYHVFDDGGSIYSGTSWGYRKIVRIPADQMVHWFKRRHGAQCRGIPLLAAVLLSLADREEFVKASLTQAWVQTNNSTFVKTDMPAEMQELWEDSEHQQQIWEWATGREYPVTEMSPGEIRFLNPFTDVKFSDPSVPGPEFDSFSTALLREGASGTGYSYEMLACDYSKTNFSSGQQVSADDQATSEDLAEDMDDQFLSPVYEDALDFIFNVHGLMAAPAEARDIYEHWVQHPVRPRIDQQKEERANTEALNNESESLLGVCKRKNMDWYDVVDEQLEAEEYRAQQRKKLGLAEPDAAGENAEAVKELTGTVGDLATQVEDLTTQIEDLAGVRT